jgi:beta-mannanase
MLCPNVSSLPNEPWNALKNCYPGDDVVDWIGIDGYNRGVSKSWSHWETFQQIFRAAYDTLKVFNKPMMVAEFASTELGGDKSLWMSVAYSYSKTFMPQIKAMTWFNTSKETDWRINVKYICAEGISGRHRGSVLPWEHSQLR